MRAKAIYLSNDHLLEVRGLKNIAADEYIDDATVTVTLVDEEGAEVSGQSWPLTLSHVAGSDGIYRGTLTDSLSLTVDLEYTAQITASGGSNLAGYWEIPLRAAIRAS